MISNPASSWKREAGASKCLFLLEFTAAVAVELDPVRELFTLIVGIELDTAMVNEPGQWDLRLSLKDPPFLKRLLSKASFAYKSAQALGNPSSARCYRCREELLRLLIADIANLRGKDSGQYANLFDATSNKLLAVAVVPLKLSDKESNLLLIRYSSDLDYAKQVFEFDKGVIYLLGETYVEGDNTFEYHRGSQGDCSQRFEIGLKKVDDKTRQPFRLTLFDAEKRRSNTVQLVLQVRRETILRPTGVVGTINDGIAYLWGRLLFVPTGIRLTILGLLLLLGGGFADYFRSGRGIWTTPGKVLRSYLKHKLDIDFPYYDSQTETRPGNITVDRLCNGCTTPLAIWKGVLLKEDLAEKKVTIRGISLAQLVMTDKSKVGYFTAKFDVLILSHNTKRSTDTITWQIYRRDEKNYVQFSYTLPQDKIKGVIRCEVFTGGRSHVLGAENPNPPENRVYSSVAANNVLKVDVDASPKSILVKLKLEENDQENQEHTFEYPHTSTNEIGSLAFGGQGGDNSFAITYFRLDGKKYPSAKEGEKQ